MSWIDELKDGDMVANVGEYYYIIDKSNKELMEEVAKMTRPYIFVLDTMPNHEYSGDYIVACNEKAYTRHNRNHSGVVGKIGIKYTYEGDGVYCPTLGLEYKDKEMFYELEWWYHDDINRWYVSPESIIGEIKVVKILNKKGNHFIDTDYKIST